jgi:hypothetical protein
MVKVAGYSPAGGGSSGLFWVNVSMLCTFWSWGHGQPAAGAPRLTTTRLIAWGLPLSFVVLAFILRSGRRRQGLAPGPCFA